MLARRGDHAATSAVADTGQWAATLRLDSSYPDGVSGREISYRVQRQAQPGDLAQVRPDGAPSLLALLLVFLVDQHFFDPGINLRAVLPAEFDSRARLQKPVDL
jgi:hypothetical protein